MDAPMTPREAVAWLLENTAATRKTYCIILRSTNGVHNPGTRHQRMGVEPMKRNCQDCTARRVGCHANCERYKADCAQDAKRRAYEKQFAFLDSMPQTATALKKTLAPRRVGGQQ